MRLLKIETKKEQEEKLAQEKKEQEEKLAQEKKEQEERLAKESEQRIGAEQRELKANAVGGSEDEERQWRTPDCTRRVRSKSLAPMVFPSRRIGVGERSSY